MPETSMNIAVISLCTFLASFLTLYSGFGLGTILMPVAALFFSVPLAVALTAFVHLMNNLCKLALTLRNVDWPVTLKFGMPALVASIPGAWILGILSGLDPLLAYHIGSFEAKIVPVKLAAGLLLIFFATAEMFPFLQRFSTSSRTLPLGGLLSGFFGGLSGHQGAFRSAFLVNAGLDKQQFIATNAAIASLVDISRLLVYSVSFSTLVESVSPALLATASLAAFLGAFLGVAWLHKMTLHSIQRIVVIMLYVLGTLLMAGIV